MMNCGVPQFIIQLNIMKQVLRNLIRISWYRWTVLFFLTVTIAYVDINSTAGISSNFLLSELSDITNICFIFLYLYLILLSDCYDRKMTFFATMLSVAFETVIFFICLFICYALALLLCGLLSCQVGNWLTKGLIKTVFLLFCRYFSFGMLIVFLDSKSRSKYGFIAPIIISIAETYFYDVFKITHSLYVLPIENSRIYYTPTYYGFNGSPPSFGFQCVYWVILIGILTFISFLTMRKKRNDKK